MKIKFGEFELDTARSELQRNGEIVRVEPQVYLTLEYLLIHHDRIVPKDELVSHVWGNRKFVSDGSLGNRISGARQAIGDTGHNQNLIKTFQGRGFRFVGDVQIDQTDKIIGAQSRKTEQPLQEDQNILITGSQPSPVNETQELQQMRGRTLKLLLPIAIIALALFGSFLFWISGNRSTPPDYPSQSTAPATPVKLSIGVLPFEDLSPEQASKFIGDGLAEEILHVLANFEDVRVPSQTSSFAFRNSGFSAGKIGEALNVDYLLEGSVRRSGNTIRISAQLVDVATDNMIWNNTYDRIYSAENFLLIQDDIAFQISKNLTGKLDLGDIDFAPRVNSIEAYEAFLEGKEFMADTSPQALDKAIEKFERTVQIDPGYTPAYTQLINARYLTRYEANISIADLVQQMKRDLALAKSHAPTNADILVAEGEIAYVEERDVDAIELYERALELNPNHALASERLAGTLWNIGKFEEAALAYKNAVELNPVDPDILTNLALIQASIGDMEGAFAATETNLKWNPDTIPGLSALARLHLANGDYEAAHLILSNIISRNDENLWAQEMSANLYSDIGLSELALETSARPWTTHLVLARSGQCETLFAQLEGQAIEMNDTAMAYYLCGNSDAAVGHVKRVGQQYGYTGADAPTSHLQLELIAIFGDILGQNNDPAAQDVQTKLKKIYDRKSPSDFQMGDQLWAGAAYHMMIGDDRTAIEWLNAMAEQGHPYERIEHVPLFSDLVGQPGFKPVKAKLNANAEQIRKWVQRDLSNSE